MEERRFFELDSRLDELAKRRQGEDPRITAALQAELEIGWIYHDNALDGIVLSREEIQAALSGRLLPDIREGALYEGIRDHKAAIDLVKTLGQSQVNKSPRRNLVTVPLLKQLHELLSPREKSQGSPYRKSHPVHRNYHHEIAPADTIPERLRKLCETLDEPPSFAHPLVRAAAAHFELMAIYPWPEENGKVARLLMNLLLLRDGYPPAVIPGTERQRYYESLRADNGRLIDLIAETVNSYCVSANQFLRKLASLPS